MPKRWSSFLLRLVLVVCISPGGNVRGERKLLPVPASRFSLDASGQSWPHVRHSGSGCEQFEKCVPAARCTVQTSGSASLRPCITEFNTDGMQFGQFVAHDFTRSSSIKLGDKDIECCAEGGSHALQGDQRHFACLPIEVRPDDPFFSKFGVRCLNFVRLALAGDPECRLGYAKQLSKVTHFIDGSPIYGSNEELARLLRTFQKGQLRNSFPFGIEELPLNQDPGVCEPWAQVCFEAGDDRVNQVVSLVQVQVLFLREHNRVAGILSHVNPHWNNETVLDTGYILNFGQT